MRRRDFIQIAGPAWLAQKLAGASPGKARMSSAALKETSAIVETSVGLGETQAAAILIARHGKIVLFR
jgi:hypothetical protein